MASSSPRDIALLNALAQQRALRGMGQLDAAVPVDYLSYLLSVPGAQITPEQAALYQSRQGQLAQEVGGRRTELDRLLAEQRAAAGGEQNDLSLIADLIDEVAQERAWQAQPRQAPRLSTPMASSSPRIRNGYIEALGPDDVFVFGSNLAGRHGKGAALTAAQRFGAEYGVGEGLTGRSYALPTKDGNLAVRSPEAIGQSLVQLGEAARANPQKRFYLTRVGQGLAGMDEATVRGLVNRAGLPENVLPWWAWENGATETPGASNTLGRKPAAKSVRQAPAERILNQALSSSGFSTDYGTNVWRPGQHYEMSTAGDINFSAFGAKLPDGRTIEEAYQQAKGYPNWRAGKGKPPLVEGFDAQGVYTDLWRQWAAENPDALNYLADLRARGIKFTDRFSQAGHVNQAQTLAFLADEHLAKRTGFNPTAFYAGVGSRETPPDVQDFMTQVAAYLEGKGYGLRSGGAKGADSAFERGVTNKAFQRSYLGTGRYNGHSANDAGYVNYTTLPGYQQAVASVDEYHPAPDRLSDYARDLMGRNSMQVLGDDLNDPSKFLIAWTQAASGRGGTGQALRIAKAKGVPILDLGDPLMMERARQAMQDDTLLDWLLAGAQYDAGDFNPTTTSGQRENMLSIVPERMASLSGMRGGQYGEKDITTVTRPFEEGWLGNPYKAVDAGGKYTRSQATQRFRELLDWRAKDPEWRKALLSLKGQQVGYYRPDDVNHLMALQDWLYANAGEGGSEPAALLDAALNGPTLDEVMEAAKNPDDPANRRILRAAEKAQTRGPSTFYKDGSLFQAGIPIRQPRPIDLIADAALADALEPYEKQALESVSGRRQRTIAEGGSNAGSERFIQKLRGFQDFHVLKGLKDRGDRMISPVLSQQLVQLAKDYQAAEIAAKTLAANEANEALPQAYRVALRLLSDPSKPQFRRHMAWRWLGELDAKHGSDFGATVQAQIREGANWVGNQQMDTRILNQAIVGDPARTTANLKDPRVMYGLLGSGSDRFVGGWQQGLTKLGEQTTVAKYPGVGFQGAYKAGDVVPSRTFMVDQNGNWTEGSMRNWGRRSFIADLLGDRLRGYGLGTVANAFPEDFVPADEAYDLESPNHYKWMAKNVGNLSTIRDGKYTTHLTYGPEQVPVPVRPEDYIDELVRDTYSNVTVGSEGKIGSVPVPTPRAGGNSFATAQTIRDSLDQVLNGQAVEGSQAPADPYGLSQIASPPRDPKTGRVIRDTRTKRLTGRQNSFGQSDDAEAIAMQAKSEALARHMNEIATAVDKDGVRFFNADSAFINGEMEIIPPTEEEIDALSRTVESYQGQGTEGISDALGQLEEEILGGSASKRSVDPDYIKGQVLAEYLAKADPTDELGEFDNHGLSRERAENILVERQVRQAQGLEDAAARQEVEAVAEELGLPRVVNQQLSETKPLVVSYETDRAAQRAGRKLSAIQSLVDQASVQAERGGTAASAMDLLRAAIRGGLR